MENSNCSSCFGPKAKYNCKACGSPTCKACAQFVDEARVAFSDSAMKTKLIGVYCRLCIERELVPELERYDGLLERASEVVVFMKEQGKESRLIKRSEKPLKVEDCVDREETISHLAFLAAKAGYNCLVDVETSSKKSHEGSYTILKWSGSGVPAKVDSKRYQR